jgi:hypothetical protein
MGDQEDGAVAEDESDELHFEDRLFLWLSAPLWPLTKLPPWALYLVGIWKAVGIHAVWFEWIYGQPNWLVLTLFGAVPMIIYACLMLLLMPWRAPPAPRPPVRSIVRQRVGRLRTAMAHRRARRVRDGGWVKVGDSGQRRLSCIGFRIRTWPGKTPLKIRWAFLALPKLSRRPAE